MDITNYSSINICRICESEDDLCYIFLEENRHVLKKLRSCADIDIDLNDELPNGICNVCVKNLEFSYKFKIQCEYTDSKFRNSILLAKEKQTSTTNNYNIVEEIEYENNIVFAEYVNVDRVLIVEDEDIDDVNDEKNKKINKKLSKYILVEDNTENNVKLETNDDEDSLINKDILKNDSHHIYESENIQENDAYTEDFELEEQIDNRNDVSVESIEEYAYENDEIQEYIDDEQEEEEEDEDDGEIINIDDGEIKNTDDDDDGEGDEELYLNKIEEEVLESEDEIILSKRRTKRQRSSKYREQSKNAKGYICETCGEKFRTYSDFNKHKKVHGKRRFQCEQCDRWFSKKYHLKNHEIVHTGEKRYKCTQCNKVYTNHGNLDRHVRVFHRKERLHVCDKCGKGFSQSTTLKQHYAVHIEERNFECNICHKRYKTQEYLNLHKDRHLPMDQRKIKAPMIKKKKPVIKICVCTYCGKKSNSVALHQSHIRTHTGEKPYECETCHKKFSFQQSLKSHLLLHTGEKPFKCEACGLTFRQIGHLKGHKLVHTGVKQHKCLVCEKTFALRGNLTVHMRLHTGETPYHCSICPKKFYDSNGLKRHALIHAKHQDPNIIHHNNEDEIEEEDNDNNISIITTTRSSSTSSLERQQSIIKIISDRQSDNKCDLAELCYDGIIQTNDTTDLHNRQEIVENLQYDRQERNNYINITTPINFVKKIKDEH